MSIRIGKIRQIHKKDVHALFIWNGDTVSLLENNISVQVYADETPIKIESDFILVTDDGALGIINVHSNDIGWLKAYVREMFPHLVEVGHPIVEGEVFDTWIAFVDERGANAINQDIAGDTTVQWPANG